MKEESQNYQNNSRLIRSYGRIKSRRLSDHKNSLFQNLLANYEILTDDFLCKNNYLDQSLLSDVKDEVNIDKALLDKKNKSLLKNIKDNFADNKVFFDKKSSTIEDNRIFFDKKSAEISAKAPFKKISFEIGFGFGDFLFAKAQSNPEQMFLGCEPHINGVVNVLAKLEDKPLSNLRVSRQDARELLNKFADDFFDEIYILFPDPWPKTKHFKRRLIDLDFLDNLLSKKLKTGGKLIIATDHASYKTWILSAILKSQKFIWNAASKLDWQVFPDDWIVTKYQKKAAKEGRVSVIFNLTKL